MNVDQRERKTGERKDKSCERQGYTDIYIYTHTYITCTYILGLRLIPWTCWNETIFRCARVAHKRRPGQKAEENQRESPRSSFLVRYSWTDRGILRCSNPRPFHPSSSPRRAFSFFHLVSTFTNGDGPERPTEGARPAANTTLFARDRGEAICTARQRKRSRSSEGEQRRSLSAVIRRHRRLLAPP